jgi:ubiquinone/menaquinone biosynthesis C-methylase UbiE
MKEDWDKRAKENALYYISTAYYESQEEFDYSGESVVRMLLHGLYEKLNPYMVILDIGCGCGRLEKHLTPLFLEVHGVDASSQMIELAKKRLKGYQNVHLHVNNGVDLSLFPNESFDFVFSYQVFQHIPRKITYNYLKEAYKVLRVGGILRFQIPQRTLQQNLMVLLRKLKRGDFNLKVDPKDDDTWSLRFFSKRELHSVLKTHGFRDIEFETILGIPHPNWKISAYFVHLWVTCSK